MRPRIDRPGRPGIASSSARRADMSSGFQPAAYNKFLEVADSFLVAQALAGGHDVVALEKPATTPSKRKIKVPDACAGVGVKSLTPYALVRLKG
jgi:hypothetical protein